MTVAEQNPLSLTVAGAQIHKALCSQHLAASGHITGSQMHFRIPDFLLVIFYYYFDIFIVTLCTIFIGINVFVCGSFTGSVQQTKYILYFQSCGFGYYIS